MLEPSAAGISITAQAPTYRLSRLSEAIETGLFFTHLKNFQVAVKGDLIVVLSPSIQLSKKKVDKKNQQIVKNSNDLQISNLRLGLYSYP